MEITRLNARTFSMLGQRGTVFGMQLPRIAAKHPETVVLSADLATLSGLDRFVGMYPDKFYNIGIAEQNMLGVAAGFASEGYRPYATTYATFISLRSCEQMRHYMGYMKLPLVLVGSGAGLVMSFSGNTHYAIEDIAVARSIPNMTVISPSDAAQAAKAIEAIAETPVPVYLRLTGALNVPMIYTSDFDYAIGKAIPLTPEGGDICIVATGSLVSIMLKTAKRLEEETGVRVTVIDMHTIKPLDTEALDRNMGARLFVTAEEHSIIGGLGGAVAEYLTEKGQTPPLLRIGIKDTFLKPGEYEFMMEQCGLSVEGCYASIAERFKIL